MIGQWDSGTDIGNLNLNLKANIKSSQVKEKSTIFLFLMEN